MRIILINTYNCCLSIYRSTTPLTSKDLKQPKDNNQMSAFVNETSLNDLICESVFHNSMDEDLFELDNIGIDPNFEEDFSGKIILVYRIFLFLITKPTLALSHTDMHKILYRHIEFLGFIVIRVMIT